MEALLAYISDQPFEQVIAFTGLVVAGLGFVFGIVVSIKRG